MREMFVEKVWAVEVKIAQAFFIDIMSTELTLCMNSKNTSQPVLRIRLKVVNLFYKATAFFVCTPLSYALVTPVYAGLNLCISG